MARFTFVVPPFHATRFTGGIWCVMQYAAGLAARGHEVTIVPHLPSPAPRWFQGGYRMQAEPRSRFVAARRLAELEALALSAAALVSKGLRPRRNAARTRALDSQLLARSGRLPFELRKATSLRFLRERLPEADATVATLFETALAVSLFGKGKRCYFMQHFEPYFRGEFPDPFLAEQDARASYRLGLELIANSSWLQGQVLAEVPGARTSLCPNAIDHAVFHGAPRIATDASEAVVLSYGGRNAEWKGFRDMAEAVRRVRERLPAVRVRWQVYGEALLPPDNAVAPYEPLGFLQPGPLAEAYRRADLLLSASWYESFPLFPIEAMACGLPAITTAPGTEEYAIAGETAEVVQPRDPASIAAGLERLVVDLPYRNALAARGHAMSQKFTWARSVETMERILLG